MAKSGLVISDEFDCIGSSGRRYTVLERTKVSMFSDMEGVKYKSKGSIDYITSDGKDVNLLEDGSFQIVVTDEILRRV